MASLNLENCLSIPDDFEGYDKRLFNIPKHYEDCVGNVLIPAGLVQVSVFDELSNYNGWSSLATRYVQDQVSLSLPNSSLNSKLKYLGQV